MAAVKSRKQLNPEIVQQLRELAVWLRIERIAARIWSEVMSADERRILGEDYSQLKMVQGYARLRGCSLERSAVDLALEASVIGASRHRRLRRAIGESIESRDDEPKPVWDADSGKLFYRGEMIRPVRAGPTHVRAILDAFQELGWPLTIDNPLPGGVNAKKLGDAMTSVNEGLAAIRFRAVDSGRRILREEASQLRRNTGGSRRRSGSL